MEIVVTHREGDVPITVLTPHGELTADSAGPFEAAASAAIERGATHLLLDLSDVSYIGSFGIRAINNVLVTLHSAADGYTEAELRQALRGGGKSRRLKLAALNPPSLKVLETSGFNLYLEVHPTVDDAVKSFQQEKVHGGH
jgi:anti-anti-sigma factor